MRCCSSSALCLLLSVTVSITVCGAGNGKPDLLVGALDGDLEYYAGPPHKMHPHTTVHLPLGAQLMLRCTMCVAQVL